MKSDIEIAQRSHAGPGHRGGRRPGAERRTTSTPTASTRPRSTWTCFDRLKDRPDGKLVLCTAITPTPAGEGKTTTNVGLSMGLNKIGKKAICTLREPSLGPCFGIKGGAAGGGYAQVVPMEDINLHFTGDIHAITTAHNLCAAVLDNHLFQGNDLNINPNDISWPRVVDLNDRALRQITIGQGGEGVERKTRFDITVASEIMAILCLATDLEDLKARLDRIIVGSTLWGRKVTAQDIKVSGSMAVLLKDAFMPNLVQTLENTPGHHPRRAVRQHRPRLQLRAGHPHGPQAGRLLHHRGRLRRRPGGGEVLRHQVPLRRPGARLHRAGRHHPRPQDARRRAAGRSQEGEPHGSGRRHGEPGEAPGEHAVLRPAGGRGHQPLPRRHRRRSRAPARARGGHGRQGGPLRRVGQGRRRRRGAGRGGRPPLRGPERSRRSGSPTNWA